MSCSLVLGSIFLGYSMNFSISISWPPFQASLDPARMKVPQLSKVAKQCNVLQSRIETPQKCWFPNPFLRWKLAMELEPMQLFHQWFCLLPWTLANWKKIYWFIKEYLNCNPLLETQFFPAVAWSKLKDKVVGRNPNILILEGCSENAKMLSISCPFIRQIKCSTTFFDRVELTKLTRMSSSSSPSSLLYQQMNTEYLNNQHNSKIESNCKAFVTTRPFTYS